MAVACLFFAFPARHNTAQQAAGPRAEWPMAAHDYANNRFSG